MTEQEVKDILQYLSGAYPQLRFDGIGTALAWEDQLNKINATFEECQRTCDNIIRKGFKDWEINISLIIEIILNQRKKQEDIDRTYQEFLENEKKEKISLKRFQELKKKYGY